MGAMGSALGMEWAIQNQPMRPSMKAKSGVLRVTLTARAESAVRQGHPWVFDQGVAGQSRVAKDGELVALYDRKDRLFGLGWWDSESAIQVRVFHVGARVVVNEAYWVQKLEDARTHRFRFLGESFRTGWVRATGENLPDGWDSSIPSEPGLTSGESDRQVDQNVTKRKSRVDRSPGLAGNDYELEWDDVRRPTNACRWVHGENDGFPGLVIDGYADVLVIKVYTAGWLNFLIERGSADREEVSESRVNLVQLAAKTFGARRVVFRCSRNMAERAAGMGLREGHVWMANSVDPSTSAVATRTETDASDWDGRVVMLENGLRFEADVVRGQKTGFFLDQRDNRRRIESLARGADVLNAFSFSGGFSVYAARGGACRVTDLDISPHALEAAKRNMALNRDQEGNVPVLHETIQCDAFEWLGAAPGMSRDVVILDPPSLARRSSEREGAMRAYERLASSGWACVRPGGWLMAASCSAHVSAEEFYGCVLSAVRRSRRPHEDVWRTGHPMDHPAGFAEAAYLKAIYIRATNANA